MTTICILFVHDIDSILRSQFTGRKLGWISKGGLISERCQITALSPNHLKQLRIVFWHLFLETGAKMKKKIWDQATFKLATQYLEICNALCLCSNYWCRFSIFKIIKFIQFLWNLVRKNMSSMKSENWEQYLKTLLECPVCLQTIESVPIFQCCNGHIVCKDCLQRLDNCPVCRNEPICVRNLQLEQLIEKKDRYVLELLFAQ